jgi:hypothetical protein
MSVQAQQLEIRPVDMAIKASYEAFGIDGEFYGELGKLGVHDVVHFPDKTYVFDTNIGLFRTLVTAENGDVTMGEAVPARKDGTTTLHEGETITFQ